MAAKQLKADDFGSYPPEARRLATQNLSLLQQLPTAFLPLLLREVIAYDWKFPAERDEIDRQFRYLSGLTEGQLGGAMSAFSKITLSPELEATDWISSPDRFSERLSSYLWASHQIDDFSRAAEDYIASFNADVPEKAAGIPRLGIVVIGREIGQTSYPLFRKLRSHGTYFTNVNPRSNSATLLNTVSERYHRYPSPYAHWYIDGAGAGNATISQVAALTYDSLAPVRGDLIRKMQESSALHLGPEAMRTRLAESEPSAMGLKSGETDPIMARFSLSVLSQGAGTQIYSTTFVQWAAREALRRARPVTLLAKFAPRQTEESADEELQGTQQRPSFDPAGSLVDADMGAYYTWINLQRLSGANAFLAWFEGRSDAVAIAPSIPAGKESHDRLELTEILRQIQSAG